MNNKFLIKFSSALFIFFLNDSVSISQDQAELLTRHLAVIRELKTTRSQSHASAHATKKVNPNFQAVSDVHMSCINFSETVKTEPNWQSFVTSHSELVNSILEKERGYADTHCVFYHAQHKDFMIVQDLLKEIFEFIMINKDLYDFQFLRPWYIFPPKINANKFIDKTNKKNPYGWTDHQTELSTKLLSVNLALFGNFTLISGGECTFDYFLNCLSICFDNDKISRLLHDIITHFNFNECYLNRLLDLKKYISCKEGILHQIFIPKKLVPSNSYISLPLGIPLKSKFPGCSYDQAKQRNLNLLEIVQHYQDRSIIDAINKDQEFIKSCGLSFEYYDHTPALKRETKIIDRLQARLIFSRKILCNPKSGIKIFRYTTLEAIDMASYKKELKEIAQMMFSEWLASQSMDHLVQHTPIAKLARQII